MKNGIYGWCFVTEHIFLLVDVCVRCAHLSFVLFWPFFFSVVPFSVECSGRLSNISLYQWLCQLLVSPYFISNHTHTCVSLIFLGVYYFPLCPCVYVFAWLFSFFLLTCCCRCSCFIARLLARQLCDGVCAFVKWIRIDFCLWILLIGLPYTHKHNKKDTTLTRTYAWCGSLFPLSSYFFFRFRCMRVHEWMCLCMCACMLIRRNCRRS